jgi:hypothetical protein
MSTRSTLPSRRHGDARKQTDRKLYRASSTIRRMAGIINTETSDHLRELELLRTRALVERDMPVIERLHAPEYQLITPSGTVFSRERYLAVLVAEPFYAKWEVGAIDVRLSAEMALLRYQATLHFPSGRVVVCWHTDSYERRGPHWQAVWSQATELKAPHSSAPVKDAA